jgi:LAO/AO transport system kinase
VHLNEENLKKLLAGDIKTVAKVISLVENNSTSSQAWLESLAPISTQVVGITGAPGAGKSTLVNSIVAHYVQKELRVAVLSVDPSSPFNYGAILGDRIRMVDHFLNKHVYIRSLASRGALGGLSLRLFEILDVVRTAGFDKIIVETVGIGQSEVDIAGVADTKVVVVVPEGGDEIQTMKAGVMEIADIFVVNKCDRPNAAEFAHNLKALSHNRSRLDGWQIPVLQTQADKHVGIEELCCAIEAHFLNSSAASDHQQLMLCEKAYQLICQQKMHGITKSALRSEIQQASLEAGFNIYEFVAKYR